MAVLRASAFNASLPAVFVSAAAALTPRAIVSDACQDRSTACLYSFAPCGVPEALSDASSAFLAAFLNDAAFWLAVNFTTLALVAALAALAVSARALARFAGAFSAAPSSLIDEPVKSEKPE